MPDAAEQAGVRVAETHISVLVFIAGRVYKLRKPVRFGFLDFSSREARQADCHREVSLNRRLSPDVYLGVADVVMDGAPIDHMVVMRALPAELQLERMVTDGSDVTSQMDATADVLARFHATADRAPSISAAATPAAIHERWMSNFVETDAFVGPVLDPEVDRDIRSLVGRWMDAHGELLAARIEEGCICDGHGDLQASDVFCLPDGVRILDCLEFSDELRYDDVCGDVAFLAMDLERLGSRGAAREFVEAYERHAGARIPPPLLHFHMALRAYIRSKVECLRHEQGQETAVSSARALQVLARRHLRQARTAVILVGGLPGTGKSTLASALAEELQWTVLRTDSIRREIVLEGVRYAPTAVDDVYAELLRRAEGHLRRQESVILDASWISSVQRDKVDLLASQAGVELLQFHCVCADRVAAARIRDRLERRTDDSEATEAVRAVMATTMDPWPEARVIDTTDLTVPESAELALSALSPSG